ncbi:receptor-type tyrosine-protein phosphatase kappa-like isoform X3 [Biomphalaria glabrata]|nr:receptor-type tyrosine-protein phosphatase kappa-like isoform X3 [Biomphalaria glabrata]XP_055897531.1 receptor-type tyrosine-protein phosphatase kappa-like isoform X3 [Biomphalaria glabrata]
MSPVTFLLLAVLTVFFLLNCRTLAQSTPPCLRVNACPNNTYCAEKPDGTISCIACDVSCELGCDGPGPEWCKSCKAGYYKPPTLLQACTECDVGFYGVNCSKQCRCLNNELCNKTDGFCNGWKCDRGYTGLPYCQDKCPINTFGLDCGFVCHCPVNDNCSNVQGDCSSGKCDADWDGPGCQRRLPKLVLPPRPLSVTCNNITIYWDAFNKSVDIGLDPIKQYNVLYKQNTTVSANGTTNWTNYISIDDLHDGRKTYIVSITSGLLQDVDYNFRVDVVGMENDKPLKSTTAGTVSAAIRNTCTTATATTPVVVISRKVFDTVTIRAVNSTTVNVDYTILKEFSGYEYDVYFTRTHLGNGDCEDGAGDRNISGPHNAYYFVTYVNLTSWSKYNIAINITAKSMDVREYYTQNITTAEVLPTGLVTNVSVDSVTSSSATVSWLAPSCSQRKGLLKSYSIYLETVGSTNIRLYSAADIKYTITDLVPYTNYSLQVAYNNSVGQGPLSPKVYFNSSEGAPSSVDIVSAIPAYSSVNITFRPPVTTNGILTTYTVMFSETVDFDKYDTVTVRAVDGQRTLFVDRLKPQTYYYFKMAASTSAALGPFGDVSSALTLQTPPSSESIKLELTNNSLKCLDLRWTPPQNGTNVITSYLLEVRRASADFSTSVNTTLAANQTSYSVCSLKPSTLYIVTLTGFSAQSVVSRVTENFSTVHGTPPAPVRPIFVRSTYTTITIAIEPVVSLDVPVTSYQLMVQKLTTQRKKRVAGLPGYVTAQFDVSNITQKMNFVIGDNQTYGDYLNLVLDNNTYYMIYYVALSTLNQLTTFSSSNLIDPVRTIPYDPATSPPVQIDVSDKSTSCMSLNWTSPEEIKNIITGFTFSLQETGNANTAPVLEELNSTTKAIRKCNLKSFTLYTATISAKSANGILTVSSNTFRTVHEPPPRPSAPVFVNSSYTTITVTLDPIVLTAGPVTAYQIHVEKVLAPSRRRKRFSKPFIGRLRRKRMSGVPGYVTAELAPSYIITKINFTVGDGKSYNGYTNQALTEKTWYTVHYVVISTSSNITYFNYSSMSPPVITVPYVLTTAGPVAQSSENNGVLIGVIVGFILFILLILLLIGLYIWWRRRNRFNPYEYQEDDSSTLELPPYKDDYDPSKYWSATNNLRESRYIIAGRELVYDYNTTPHPKQNKGPNLDSPLMSFKDEYQGLPHKSSRATDNAARSYRNFNRFPHLLPYDHSLVSLKSDINVHRTYINASFIPGFRNSISYIAAQSPYDDETALDFWRLIYQRSIKTIVMITNVVEDDIVKCTQYWPDKTKASYGHFLLHMTEVLEYADYTIRTIELHCKGDKDITMVKLFEYTSWPEHGVPDDPIPFLDMRYKIRQNHAEDPSPILVHCGTGMGRTGVFIAVDALVDQYALEGKVAVYSYIKKMRKHRPYMVRTLRQYVFIYEALFEKFHAGSTLASFDLKDRYHNWMQINPKTEHSYLRDQFELLEKFTRGPRREDCKAAFLPANIKKNRYLDVVPSEMHRPLLQSYGGVNPTDYINALFVDGYMKRNQFIVTQTPLQGTIIDFWKLVYDYNVHTIVMVENSRNEDDTCAEYWPSLNLKHFEPLFVETTAVYQQENITIRNFKIRSTQHPKVPARFVRQFQFNAWVQPNLTPQSKTMMMDFIDSVFRWQDEACQNETPVVVHCQDGATHSGLFVILAILCDKMELNKEVDVYHTIKHCKRRRTQFIADYDQFRFCYKTVWDFMNLRMSDGAYTNTLGESKSNPAYTGASLNLSSTVFDDTFSTF